MTLHRDLLDQALHLASKEPRRPKQASLRRSVSASYYALYHLLVDSAVRRLLAGADRDGLRNSLRRGFAHRTMKNAARQFAAGGLSPKPAAALGGRSIQPQLSSLADTFVDLQEYRHLADYDLTAPFTRDEALGLQLEAELAFDDWNTVRCRLCDRSLIFGTLGLG